MANFNTHLTIAAAGSTLLSTLCLKAGYVGVADAFLLTLTGTIGGILPDIDLKYSHPSKILFSLLATLAAMLWVFSTDLDLSTLELWFGGLLIYLLIRYPVWLAFHSLAVHRGSIHSVAAALLAGFTTAVLCDFVFGREPFIAWLAATAMFAGFILHLLLDEIYSVDFMGYRIKRSFGSALKLLDTKNIMGSALILLLSMVLWFYTPSADTFLDTLKDKDRIHEVRNEFLPNWLKQVFSQHE
ncbi:MAG: metal-dependent hydrolase [Gammaproteobacteria bacterium]|nr:metal-dependent hydrolase [Gammaproteobacteria bacterium]